MRAVTRTTLLLAMGLIAALSAVPAHASKSLQVGIEDERHMLDEAAEAPQIVEDWQKIGIQVVRLHANWARIAPKKPSTPANPNDAAYQFGQLDNAINLVTQRGMAVHLTITGPPASWARTDTSRSSTRWKPSATKFAQFATAVAKRYKSKVKTFMIWNEPNVDQWIQPQGSCTSNAKCKANAGSIYRDIVRKSYTAIKTVNPSAKVLIGELAPRGKSGGGQTKPLVFMRAFACVDKAFKPITKGACKNYKAPVSSGFAYHPHPVKLRPNQSNPDPDNAQIGDTARLVTFLDKLVSKKRLKFKTSSGKATISYTEFGYQTNPPDPVDGVSQQKQSTYLQESAYICWKNPRITTLIHYQWFDAPLTKSKAGNPYSEWQSGLFFNDRTKKLAYDTFSHPFWVQRTKGKKTAEFWGQVRPGGATTIAVQRKPSGAADFENVTTARTDGNGYWNKYLKVPQTATYRFIYTDSSGQVASQEYRVQKTS